MTLGAAVKALACEITLVGSTTASLQAEPWGPASCGHISSIFSDEEEMFEEVQDGIQEAIQEDPDAAPDTRARRFAEWWKHKGIKPHADPLRPPGVASKKDGIPVRLVLPEPPLCSRI